MDRTLETLPVVSTTIHGAQAAAARAGGTLMLAEVPVIEQIPDAIESHRLDGMLLKGALQGEGVRAMFDTLLKRLGRPIPTVWLLARPSGCTAGDVVCSNDFEVGRLAAELLHARGHRHVAFVNPKADHVTLSRRESSFHWHCRRLGLDVRSYLGAAPERWELPLQPVRDVACVDELIEQLLCDAPRATALFAPADSIAALVYRALAARGLRVGRDVSVISCNNERPIIDGLFPSLTTLDTRSDAIGRRAVDQLLWRMGHPDEPAVEINVEPVMVEAESVQSIERA